MAPKDNMLIRPVTLVEDLEYLMKVIRGNGAMVILTPVKFVSYTSCPEFVVVSNGTGHRIRCLRDDLFMQTSSAEDGRQ